ncbi:MAG: pilus assembly protein [Actinomycetota bacterium]|nr:pilus assembly protein [Actinomycetota bacterium]
MRRGRGAPHDREQGAALVEFALLFPVFMTLILGMFTGGLAYNQDISLAHAAREGARYGATLPKGSGGTAPDAWREAIKARVLEAATNDLNLAKPGHYICVALVTGAGGVDGNYHEHWGDAPVLPNECYLDGVTDTAGRVHVLVGRPGKIQLLFTSYDLKLTSKGTSRYEDPTP